MDIDIGKVSKSRHLLELLIFFIIFHLINLGLHEMGHYFAADILGYSAYVRFDLIHAFTVVALPFGTIDGLIIGLSGGLFAGTIFLVLALISTNVARDMMLGFFVTANFIYMIAEGLWGYGILHISALNYLAPILAGIVFVFLLYLDNEFKFFGKTV